MKKYTLPTLIVLGFVALLGFVGGIEIGCCTQPENVPPKLNGLIDEGCLDSGGGFLCRFHDIEKGATCWVCKYHPHNISCIPDSQLKQPTDLPAENPTNY